MARAPPSRRRSRPRARSRGPRHHCRSFGLARVLVRRFAWYENDPQSKLTRARGATIGHSPPPLSGVPLRAAQHSPRLPLAPPASRGRDGRARPCVTAAARPPCTHEARPAGRVPDPRGHPDPRRARARQHGLAARGRAGGRARSAARRRVAGRGRFRGLGRGGAARLRAGGAARLEGGRARGCACAHPVPLLPRDLLGLAVPIPRGHGR